LKLQNFWPRNENGVAAATAIACAKTFVSPTPSTWDKMNSYSFDQQPADLKISVTLRAAPEKVSDLYAKCGRLDAAAATRLPADVT